jgi:hypothetical protein
MFRDRLINNIAYAIREAESACAVSHPGMLGRIRELVAEHLLKPMLPAGFEIGTGKIVDNQGNQSAETDLVIYSRAVLPPVMYSERDGVFPVESSYYAIEVKSRLTGGEVQDAIRKGRTITALCYPGKQEGCLRNRTQTVLVLFAFASNLADPSSELDRYAEYDSDWLNDPVLKAICVVGRGYWYHRPADNGWVFHAASPDYDEVIDFVSGVVNTVLRVPPFERVAPLGHYLMVQRGATVIQKKSGA